MIFETNLLRAAPLPERPDWIVIIGETTARVFYMRGDKLVFIKELISRKAAAEALRPVVHPIVTGRDGRRYRTVTSKSSARLNASVFCKELAGYLDQACARDFDRLVIIAAPGAMIWIKASMTPDVQMRVLAESAIDMTHLSGRDLEKHIEAIYPVKD